MRYGVGRQVGGAASAYELTTYTPSWVPNTPSNFLPRVTWPSVNCLRQDTDAAIRSGTGTHATRNGRSSWAEVR